MVEALGQQPDSRATLGHTSEHYRGSNVGEVVFASKDNLKQVSKLPTSYNIKITDVSGKRHFNETKLNFLTEK